MRLGVLPALFAATVALHGVAAGGELASPEPPIALTADESATVAGGGIAVRLEPTEAGAQTVAVLDVAASPRQVLEAVLDVRSRVDEVGAIKGVELYEPAPIGSAEGDRMGVRWQVSTLGRTVVFHTLYDIDRDAGYCVYALDDSKDNDVLVAQGSYHAYAAGQGSRLVYRSVSDAGVSVPQWVKSWFAKGYLTDQLEGIRTRAESASRAAAVSGSGVGG